ncbi:hypothetical protein [Streptomyces xanthophaeus]
MTDSTGAAGAGDAGGGGAERTSGAGAAFPPYPTGPSPLLTHVTREILKATLVQLEGSPPPTVQALLKSAFVRRLALSAGEVEEVRARLRDSGREQVAGPDTGRNGAVPDGVPEGVFDLLGRGATGFAGTDGPAKVPAAQPPASAFAAVPAAALKAVGDALVEVRRAAASAPDADPVRCELAVHAAVVATKALEANSVAPKHRLDQSGAHGDDSGGHRTGRAHRDDPARAAGGDGRHAQGMVGAHQGVQLHRDRLAGEHQ